MNEPLTDEEIKAGLERIRALIERIGKLDPKVFDQINWDIFDKDTGDGQEER